MDLEPVRKVDASLVGGDITVVAHASASRIEAEVLRGPPLTVRTVGGTATIRHRRRWPLDWIVPFRNSRASIVVFVPAESSTRVRSVSAEVLVSGTQAGVNVRNVSGSLTLAGVSGTVVARNVSGNVDAEGVTGKLLVKSVSGDVTASGVLDDVRIRAVSGTVTLDLGHAADVGVKSVSGDVSIRVPAPADLTVDARTTSGRFDSAFDLAGSRNGHKRMTGRIGTGSGTGHGTMKVATVSGDFALLRRAEDADPPEAEAV
jgi:hypothetical protein